MIVYKLAYNYVYNVSSFKFKKMSSKKKDCDFFLLVDLFNDHMKTKEVMETRTDVHP